MSLGVFGAACGGGGNACDYDSTFDAIASQIFEAKGCTNAACHGSETNPAGGLDLREGFAFDSLMELEGQSAPIDLVFSGDESRSLLYLKLAAKTRNASFEELLDGEALEGTTITGDGMPQGALPALTEEELGVIEAWIRSGAQRDGIVAGTEKALNCADGVAVDPNKIQPLDPPNPDDGVQLYSGAWDLPAESEDEVCYVTFYDFTGLIPADALTTCPAEWGENRDCFSFGRNMLAQDPQSHHSIIQVYTPDVGPKSADWDEWTCLGGDSNGQSCDPEVAGVCGSRSQCSTTVETSLACVGYPHAPSDFSGANPSGASGSREGLSGAQEATFIDSPLAGVYSILPVRGFVSWNSHAFNLTTKDTTIEQWVNLDFIKTDDPPNGRLWRRQQIFEADQIFGMGRVAPFTQKEICRTFNIPQYSQLMSLSSHMHQRGILFRIWGPPQEPCEGGAFTQSSETCLPPAAGEEDPTFMYLSRVYNDPAYNYYDPPLSYPSEDENDRTFLACAVYDNGADNIMNVKRHSTRPNSAVCDEGQLGEQLGFAGCGCDPEFRVCLGGPDQGTACNGDDSVCGGSGVCDACPLAGGITTDDEMFIPLGSYYVQPPAP